MLEIRLPSKSIRPVVWRQSDLSFLHFICHNLHPTIRSTIQTLPGRKYQNLQTRLCVVSSVFSVVRPNDETFLVQRIRTRGPGVKTPVLDSTQETRNTQTPLGRTLLGRQLVLPRDTPSPGNETHSGSSFEGYRQKGYLFMEGTLPTSTVEVVGKTSERMTPSVSCN